MSALEYSLTSLNSFVPLGKIGTGSFSSVYKVRRVDDNQVYALKKVKIVSMSERQKQNALNQIRILASIDCQNVIGYKEAFFDEKLNLLCIVMQFADEGDLSKSIQQKKRVNNHFQQFQVWKAIHHLLRGLDTLHGNSVIHRDIKSANVFVSEGVYKLGDMNVSKIQSAECRLAFTQTGTPNYASPEVWRDQPYDFKSDIWSLGCVIYEMCTFKSPFKGKNLDDLFRSVQKGYYDPIPKFYSSELSQFIALCLKKNPFDRPSSKQFLKTNGLVMRHVSFTDSSVNSHQTKHSIIYSIRVPHNLKDLKKHLPKSRYSSQEKPTSKPNKDIPKLTLNETEDFASPIKLAQRISIKHIENPTQLECSRNLENEMNQKKAALLRKISSLKSLGRKNSVPESYSLRPSISDQLNPVKIQRTSREDLRDRLKKEDYKSNQAYLLLISEYQKKANQQKQRLKAVKSEKSIPKIEKRISIQQPELKIPSSYLEASAELNPESVFDHKLMNYVNPYNNISDSDQLCSKLKKIGSPSYLSNHSLRIQGAMDRVKKINQIDCVIKQRRLSSKKYLLIQSRH